MTNETESLQALMRGETPLIAVSFADRISDTDIGQAKAAGVDVAELRIDRFSSFDVQHVIGQVRRFASLPTIATIRTKSEGGEWVGTDEDRLDLFLSILPYVHGVDIELTSMTILPALIEEAKKLDKVVIVSSHNFQATPAEPALEDTARRAKAAGADYVKLSVFARSLDDVQTLARFTMDNKSLGLIVIAMGPDGSISRVAFPAFGSVITYAHTGSWPVSGQLTFDDTFDMLRRFYPEFNEKKIIQLQLSDDA